MLCLEERRNGLERSSHLQNIFSLLQSLFTQVVFLFSCAFTILTSLSLNFVSHLPELPKLAPQPCTLAVTQLLGLHKYLKKVLSPPSAVWGQLCLFRAQALRRKYLTELSSHSKHLLMLFEVCNSEKKTFFSSCKNLDFTFLED